MLDTNIASAAIRGEEAVQARLRDMIPQAWCISSITRSELRFGIERMPRAVRLARIVGAFLDLAATAPWDLAAADAHARLRAQLERKGTPIGAYDEMIAGHALAIGAVVVTDNERHFRRVEGLAVENWLRH